MPLIKLKDGPAGNATATDRFLPEPPGCGPHYTKNDGRPSRNGLFSQAGGGAAASVAQIIAMPPFT
jgi:hypothetical protein